jgi:hypothetical protein
MTCDHEYNFSHTSYEYPEGWNGTTVKQEYAYFVCNKCQHVKKTLVEQPQNPVDSSKKGQE